jgi:hypothetical protein
MKSVASAIREKAPHLATNAVKVADGLESASNYLQEKKFEHLGEDSGAWFVATPCDLY